MIFPADSASHPARRKAFSKPNFAMEGKAHSSEKVCIRSLQELDALVGKHLTGEKPRIHWLNTQTDFRFDTIEDAVESLRDPFFSQLLRQGDPSTTVILEVREYQRYSSELTIVWDLVAQHSRNLGALRVRRDGQNWDGAFGEHEYVRASTAPIAICLAALRACGIDAECKLSPQGLPDAEISSQSPHR